VLRDPRRYGIKNTTDKVRRPGELESRGYVRHCRLFGHVESHPLEIIEH
jgi:hypothetical protein